MEHLAELSMFYWLVVRPASFKNKKTMNLNAILRNAVNLEESCYEEVNLSAWLSHPVNVNAEQVAVKVVPSKQLRFIDIFLI